MANVESTPPITAPLRSPTSARPNTRSRCGFCFPRRNRTLARDDAKVTQRDFDAQRDYSGAENGSPSTCAVYPMNSPQNELETSTLT